MAMDLGLESLVDNKPAIAIDSDSISYEDLNTVLEFSDAANEALIVSNDLEGVVIAIQNVTAVSDVVAKYGVTDALKDLVGENFKTEDISTEAAAAKEGLWARFVKFLKMLWAKIKAFFAQFFVGAKKMASALRARVAELRKGKMEPITVKLPGADVIKGLFAFFKMQCPGAVEEIKKSIENMKKGKDPDGNKQSSATLAVLFKRMGEVAEQGLNTYENPDNVELSKEACCIHMELIADLLDILCALKGGIEAVASAVNAMSERAEAAFAADMGKGAKAAVDYVGSDDFRKQIANCSSMLVKILNRATRKTVAYGSLCLSTFKVAKGE